MREYSHIRMTRFADSFGNTERVEYKWNGKSPLCMIGYRDLALISYQGKMKNLEFMYGPFRLRLMDRWTEWGEIECIRLDYPFWWVYVAIHRVNRFLDLFYRRAIITASVWKLAEYSAGRIPSYRDLYIVIWIKERFQK